MLEIYHNLFVGSLEDYQSIQIEPNAYVLHAAKEPYHREFVGYTGRACDKEHPEYLRAIRGREIALNLVDAPKAEFFDYALIKQAVADVLMFLLNQKKVYIHCNRGESRAPGIAMLVLLGLHVLDKDYDLAQRQFLSIYPNYLPGTGIEAFIKNEWQNFVDYFEKHKPTEQELKEDEEGVPLFEIDESKLIPLNDQGNPIPKDADLHAENTGEEV